MTRPDGLEHLCENPMHLGNRLFLALCIAAGLMLPSLALCAAAPGLAAAPSGEEEAAWGRVKALMEAGPMALGSVDPVTVRLSGEPCTTRLVPVGRSGPLGSGNFVQWRQFGRASSQAVTGGHVVHFDGGEWLGFPPFEAAKAQEAARAFNELIVLCEKKPLADKPPTRDRYLELEATFNRLKTELEAVVATDIVSRRFTYRVEPKSSACHFNVIKKVPGDAGSWLGDNYVNVGSGSRYSSVSGSRPFVAVSVPNLGQTILETDTPARGQSVLALLNQLHLLCVEFQAK
ncbi:MAG: hypothetical protein ABIP44_13660 [Pseudoxanthomonas sp.]